MPEGTLNVRNPDAGITLLAWLSQLETALLNYPRSGFSQSLAGQNFVQSMTKRYFTSPFSVRS